MNICVSRVRVHLAALRVLDEPGDLREHRREGRGRDERVPRRDRRGGVVERRRREDGADRDPGLALDRVHRERGELTARHGDVAPGPVDEQSGRVVAEDELAEHGEGLQ